jgi:O-antigen ligase
MDRTVGGFSRVNLALNGTVVALAFALPVSRAAVTVFASLIILLWFLEGRFGATFDAVRRSPTLAAILLFIALNALSLLWTRELAEGLGYLGKYRYLLLAPVLATSMRPRFVVAAVRAFLVGTTVSVLWSFGIFLGFIHYGKGYPEHPAPSMSHLDYSMFLAVAALLVLDRLLRRWTGRQRAVGAALLLLMVAGLLINIGRSGQLAFFVTLMVVVPFYLPGRPWRKVLVGGSIVVLAALLAYRLVPVFTTRVDSAVDETRAALFEQHYTTNQGKRIAGMVVAADIVRRHPVLGTGLADNMIEFHALLDDEYEHLAPALDEYMHLHNQYLQVATELGILGLAGLIGIFVCLLRYRPADPSAGLLPLIVASTYLVGFVGDPFLHKQLPLVLFATAVGLLLADRSSVWRDESEPVEDEQPQ